MRRSERLKYDSVIQSSVCLDECLDRIKISSQEGLCKYNNQSNIIILDIRHKADHTEQEDSIPCNQKSISTFDSWLRFQAKRINDSLETSPNSIIVVHCKRGMSRSPVVVVAFLILYRGLAKTYIRHAYDYLQSRRHGKRLDALRFKALLDML